MRTRMLVIVTLVLTASVVAQTDPLPSGEEVLTRYVQHVGGRAAYEAISNRVSRGTVVLPDFGLEGSTILYQAAPNRMTMLIELPGFGTVNQGTNGEDVWEVSPGGARVVGGDEKKDALVRSRLRFDVEIGTLFTDITMLGVQPVDGRPCYAVRMVSPLGHPTTRFFDRTSYELIKETAVSFEQGSVVTSDTIYEDYRVVDGLRLPFKMTERSRGQTIILAIDSIEHDVELPDDAFAVPEAVRQVAGLAGPGPGQIAWLEERAHSFDTVEAGHGFADLEPLRAMIGDARIVSLGESTHGSREIFQMKHRLLEFLATEMGFRIFSIEASLPESFRVSDYAVRGEGDPRRLIGGMYFWTWNTEEVLDMVEWMRRFNQHLEAEGGKDRLTFTGFDMQFPDVALGIVRDFAATADPALARILAELPPSLSGMQRAQAGGSFATCTGTFPVQDAAGKSIRFSGFIRTEDVDGWAGLWWRADKADGSVGAFDNMQTRAPKGDTPWTRYELVLDVPADVVNINFGMLMSGGGTAWFDGLQVHIDGEPYASKQHDLALDAAGHRGFFQANPQYETRLVQAGVREGQGCLQLSRIGQPAAGPDRPAPDVARRIVERAITHLETHRETYDKDAPEDVEWATQNARVVRQYLDMISGNALADRDRSMAANVRWILEQKPDAKIVLWAHNLHVSTLAPWMGHHLETWYGDDHVPVGFATTRGTYTAVGEGSLGSHELQEPPPTSIEAFFVEAGMPRAIVDLRLAQADDAASRWLTERRPFRSIGAMAMAEQFSTYDVTDLFEILIYIETTEASIPLR